MEAGWEDELGKKMAVVIKNLMDKAERTHFFGSRYMPVIERPGRMPAVMPKWCALKYKII